MDKTTVEISLEELTAIHALAYAQISSNEKYIRKLELAKMDTSDFINSNEVLEGIIKKLESASVNLFTDRNFGNRFKSRLKKTLIAA